MDALSIVDTLKMLRADEQLMSRLSAGALAFCQEHFSWSRNAATLEEFYEQIRVTQPEQAHAPSPAVP
jgi:glycosyltransferase involved in cell wall biosynthesis